MGQEIFLQGPEGTGRGRHLRLSLSPKPGSSPRLDKGPFQPVGLSECLRTHGYFYHVRYVKDTIGSVIFHEKSHLGEIVSLCKH